jgi:transposase
MVAAWAKAVSIKRCLKKIFENFCNFLFSPHFFPMLRRPKILKAELRQWKCMMIVALWKKQILTYEILPDGVTVDNVVYLNFLERRVLPEVNKKKFGRAIILHDNAKPHKHRIVTEFLQEKRLEELEHPPYSPDMSPPDMDAIQRIKAPHKGKQFQTRDELIRDYDATIQEINREHTSLGISMLPDRWRAIHLANGKYVE